MEGINLTTNLSYLPVSVSENGLLLYAASGSSGAKNQIGWFDRTGKSLGLVGTPGAVSDPALSPDEKLVAYRRDSSTGSDLWIRDLSRGTETRFTSHASVNAFPPGPPKVIALSSNHLAAESLISIKTVSYTHLTLPTIYSV